MYFRWWAIVMLLLAGRLAAAQELNQFALASQQDWSARKGLFVVLDNRYSGKPSELEKLRITVGIGDSKAWAIRSIAEPFAVGRLYRLRMVYTEGTATVFVNDEQREQFTTGFVPAGGRLFAFDHHEWARRPAEYRVIQKTLTVKSGDQNVELSAGDAMDARRYVFNPGSGQTAELKLADAFTLEATFEIKGAPDLEALAPLVDRYGQVNFADWDGKIREDEQLRAALAEEERRLAQWEAELPPMDRFGGRTDLGWREPATGFFRVVERHGKWWLISPEGNPTFFTGIANAPSTTWDATPVSRREFIFEQMPEKSGPMEKAWSAGHWGDGRVQYFAPQARNLFVQHGEDWQEAETRHAIRRMRAWGFSGMGKWTTLPEQTRLPVLTRDGVPNLVRHPDTFDADVRTRFKEVLAQQIAGRESDPWIIGWSLGNEMDESFTPDEVRRILNRDDAAPAAKREMIRFALDKLFEGDVERLAKAWRSTAQTLEQMHHLRLVPRPQDIEPLRLFLADHYFAFVYRTVKELAPNHLYMGHWILPTYWHNENDWKHVAPHCDVIGFDLYEYDFADAKVQKAIRESKKPVFCGEFGFPAFWDGTRGFGRFRTAVKDEAEAGERYARWVEAAAQNKWCVGVSVFQYRDQPVTGRGPVATSPPAAVQGENYAFGMVDITNVPRWELLERVRQANLAAPLKRRGE